MPQYQHVLAAVDLTEEAPEVLEHAQQIARKNDAQLTVMTVVRPITYACAGIDLGWVSRNMADLEVQSEKMTKEKLAELTDNVGIQAANTCVILGAPAASIKTYVSRALGSEHRTRTASRTYGSRKGEPGAVGKNFSQP